MSCDKINTQGYFKCYQFIFSYPKKVSIFISCGNVIVTILVYFCYRQVGLRSFVSDKII